MGLTDETEGDRTASDDEIGHPTEGAEAGSAGPPKKLTRREVLKRLGGLGAVAAGAVIPLESLDEVGPGRQRNPRDSGLHLPISPQSAHDLDVFLHAISDPAYRAKLKADPHLEDGALQLIELADDEAVMADLVDAGIAVFDFLSGHRTKQEVKVSHDSAIAKVQAKYPIAMSALEGYRASAHPRYLEYVATQKVYDEWMTLAENGDFPLQKTPTGYTLGDAGTMSSHADIDGSKLVSTAPAGSPNTGVTPNFFGTGVVIIGVVVIGALVNIAIYANVAIATLAVVVLAVIPPSVTSSGWNPAWSTVG